MPLNFFLGPTPPGATWSSARRRWRRWCSSRSSSARPPSAGRPIPASSRPYPRPDWYFLWYFAVLALTPKHLETIVIVLGPLVFGAFLLLVPIFNRGERSVRRRPWARAAGGVHLDHDRRLLVRRRAGRLVARFLGQAAARRRCVGDTRPGRSSKAPDSSTARGASSATPSEGTGEARARPHARWARRMTPDQIVARITNGGPNMPAYARSLTPARGAGAGGVPGGAAVRAGPEPVARGGPVSFSAPAEGACPPARPRR